MRELRPLLIFLRPAGEPERMADMAPVGNLLFGLFMLLIAVIGNFTGKAYGKGVANRTDDPAKYWVTLAIEYLGAAFFIGYWIIDKLG